MSAAPVLRKAKEPSSAAARARDGGVCDHCGDSLAGLKVVERTFVGERVSRAYCCLGCAFIAEQLFLARASNRDRAAIEASVAATARAPLPDAKSAQFDVRGMVCAACALLIEHRLRREPGIESAHVDFAARRAYVRFDPHKSSVAAVGHAIGRIGYATGTDAAAERKAQRVELLRLLIAWLAMMQVMMLAVPAYFAAPGDIPRDIAQLLRIGQLILTVPVMLFCAAPLFRAAASQIRAGQVGMDLPIVLGLLAAFGASLVAVGSASGAVYFDSITMFVALVLGSRWLQARLLARAAGHIGAVERNATLTARRLRAFPASSAVDTIAAEQLRRGDHVVVVPGETVPADGWVVRGASSVSQAWLTGEATPIEKNTGAAVLAGCVNLDQPLVIEVTRSGEATSLAALRRLVDEAGRDRPRIVEIANRAAVVFLWGALAVTAMTALVWFLIDPAQAAPNAIAVLIATCPCALSLAAPAAITATQSALAQRGVLTARASALQQAARAAVVACDKTGTLTEAAPALSGIVMLRNGPAPRALSIAAALETLSMHPFARAMTARAGADRLPLPEVRDGRVEGSAGVEGAIDGVRYRVGRPAFALALAALSITRESARLSDLLRERGLSSSSVALLADERGPIALFAFAETLKPDAPQFADAVRASGAELILLSGDRREAVERAARLLKIERGFAHQTPESKRQFMAEMQRAQQVVAMVGDGLNDAPVIAQADVSIALADGAALAQARADFIVTSPRLADAAAVFAAARRGMAIVQQNLAWTVVYNLIAIPLAALGLLTPALAAVGMAASSLIVVGNALRARRLRSE